MRKVMFLFAVLVALSIPAYAQPFMELTPTFGYTFGGNFGSFSATGLQNAEADIQNSSNYGLIFDIGKNADAFEINWTHQSSTVESNVPAYPEADYKSDNFQLGWQHYFLYDEPTKPFVNLSFGWNDFKVGDASADGKFSMAIGGGVSHYFNERVGVRVQARWIPTYVNTTDPYIVCDPFGFCYAVGNDNYLYQTDVSLGLILKLR